MVNLTTLTNLKVKLQHKAQRAAEKSDREAARAAQQQQQQQHRVGGERASAAAAHNNNSGEKAERLKVVPLSPQPSGFGAPSRERSLAPG